MAAGPAADAVPGPTERPGRLARLAGGALGLVAAATLFAMMALAFVDVWGRYLFRRPVFGGYEVTEFMMGVLIFTALPLLCAREGHVTIDLLDQVLRPAWARWQRLVVNVISGGALAVMSWQLWVLSGDHARYQEVTMTLKIPHAPFSTLFAVMAALAALACWANAWEYYTGRRTLADRPS